MLNLKPLCVSALIGFAAGLAQPSVVSAAEEWQMALAYSATNYHSELAAEFAKNVTEATGGELKIVTHPAGSLYKGSEIFGAVRRGLAPIGERLISALGNEDPLFEIDALPFLATSFGDSWKLYQASKPGLEEVLKKKRMTLLYAVPWPPQGLFAMKPIESVADMKGVKFRAYNAMTSRVAELMGAVPTKIEAAELSQAFATGVAESMISSGSTGYDRKLWEYVNHWYDVQAWLPKNMVIVNTKAWDALDDEIKAKIEAVAADTEKAGWAKAEELAGWYKEQLAANGMQVGPAGDKLTEDFKAIGETLVNEWLERAGDAGKATLESYRSM